MSCCQGRSQTHASIHNAAQQQSGCVQELISRQNVYSLIVLIICGGINIVLIGVGLLSFLFSVPLVLII